MKIKINIEPSLKKSNDDHVLELWRPPAVWISPTKNNNQQWQIVRNSKKITWSH
jgi:hypothetical protein